MCSRRLIREWWYGKFVSPESGDRTNDESIDTVWERVIRHRRKVPLVRFARGRVSTCVIDSIFIGWVGPSRSQEVFVAGGLSCLTGQPRLAKSAARLGEETRRSEKRIDQAGEEL